MLYNNKSLERALQILSTFNAEQPKFTLAELSQAVYVPKATVLRLCSTLVHYDFLMFNKETRQYSLGLKLFELGSVVFASFSLRRIAAPYLINLQTKLGKTVFLGILQEGQLVYIDKKENPLNLIKFGSQIGTRRPPFFGMLGNVLMAHLSSEKVTELLKRHPLTALTKRSITNDRRFRERLAAIREQGYCVDEGEAIEGITGIAVPIRDSSKEVVAAVGVGFVSSSEDEKGVARVVRETRKTADLISRAMGYMNDRSDRDLHMPAERRLVVSSGKRG
ncbi:MAG TPA: IclR family transcriptional regulator [Syntrophorhabdales bacterium]|nr:IclR family transcriptional regulator [Syntrophorhabdales bacterium]